MNFTTITDDTDKCECEAELARLQAMQATWRRAIEAVNASDRSDDAKIARIDYIDDELAAATDDANDCVKMLDNYAWDRGGISDALADRNWHNGRVL